MTTQLRILCLLAVLALGAGWLGLHRGNAALETKVTAEARR